MFELISEAKTISPQTWLFITEPPNHITQNDGLTIPEYFDTFSASSFEIIPARNIVPAITAPFGKPESTPIANKINPFLEKPKKIGEDGKIRFSEPIYALIIHFEHTINGKTDGMTDFAQISNAVFTASFVSCGKANNEIKQNIAVKTEMYSYVRICLFIFLTSVSHIKAMMIINIAYTVYLLKNMKK